MNIPSTSISKCLGSHRPKIFSQILIMPILMDSVNDLIDPPISLQVMIISFVGQEIDMKILSMSIKFLYKSM